MNQIIRHSQKEILRNFQSFLGKKKLVYFRSEVEIANISNMYFEKIKPNEKPKLHFLGNFFKLRLEPKYVTKKISPYLQSWIFQGMENFTPCGKSKNIVPVDLSAIFLRKNPCKKFRQSLGGFILLKTTSLRATPI